MYHAIMTYCFKPDAVAEASGIWKEHVAEVIQRQPGFVKVQFYVQAEGTAIAIGSWESAEYAQAFMRTGVFAKLLEALEGFMLKPPQGGVYEQVIG